MKKYRVDMRFTELEMKLLEELKTELSCNRTDLIIKMSYFCLCRMKEFRKYYGNK